MSDQRLRQLDRRLRRALRKASSDVRVDVARHAMEAVATDLPTDEPVVREFLHRFRIAQPTDDDDESLDELALDYSDVLEKAGTDEAFRRYQSIETLSWAAMLADGDDRDVNYPSVELTLGCALLTCREDPVRQDAILVDARRRLGID